MKPTANTGGETMTASEPSNVGAGRWDEGGAAAPRQKAEHALQDECDNLPA
jgi:hypothetical protein